VIEITTESGSKYWLRTKEGKVEFAGVNVPNDFSLPMPEHWYEVAALFETTSFFMHAALPKRPFPTEIPPLTVGMNLVVGYILRPEDPEAATFIDASEGAENAIRIRTKRTSPMLEIQVIEEH
jgi:hypothetical protein